MKTTLRVFVLFFGIGIWQTSASIAEPRQEAARSESQRSDGRASGSGIATVVGSSGTILRSTDGGDTWTSQVSGYEYGFTAVSFVDANTGTAVGGQTIVHTTDGGDTWTRASVPGLFGCIAPGNLSSVSLANADVGFAVGTCAGTRGSHTHVTLRTTDGGDTWRQVDYFTVPPNTWLLAIATADATDAIAVGHFLDYLGRGGGAYSTTTTDGGSSWSFTPLNPGLAVEGLLGVAHPTPDTAIAVGFDLSGGVILRSAHGFYMWMRQYSAPAILYAVSSPDDQIAVVVGAAGTILRTIDAGETWTEQLSGTSESLLGVSFKDGDNGIAVGYGGIILRTTDGGETWISRVWNDQIIFGGVSFLPATP